MNQRSLGIMGKEISTEPSYPRLLGDIGGTNARFAWLAAPGATLSHSVSTPCDRHPTLQSAIEDYLARHAPCRPRCASLGMANPVQGDAVRMTNGQWSFSISALQKALGLSRLTVVNDFAALALALPDLRPEHLHAIGPGLPTAGEPLAVLGAGTGLGVAGLLPLPDGSWRPVPGEGGHATLAGADAFEDAVIARLRARFGHASAERALSGPGLLNLYTACAEIEGQAAPIDLEPADVMRRAAEGDTVAARVIALFCGMLGSVAGNLALTLGARGGVYIGGGIAPRLLDALRGPQFRARFEAKGRFAAYLATIPCYVIDAAVSPALLGASRALDAGA